MTQLIVRRLTASARAADEPRVRRLLAGLADSGLDRALAGAGLPAGDWCLRRVAVTVPMEDDRGDAWLEEQWSAALIAALRQLIGRGNGDAVHYPRPVDGVADLLAGAAAGRTEREWAWRQLGLLAAGDPSVAAAPRAAAVAAVRRRPELALAALTGAIQRVGVEALHRLLAPGGWTEVAAAVRAAHGPGVPGSLAEHTPESGGPGVPGSLAERTPESGREVDRLAEDVLDRSRLAAAFRRARIRADPETAAAWAVLAGAEAEPALTRRPAANAVLARLAAAFGGPPAPKHRTEDAVRVRDQARPVADRARPVADRPTIEDGPDDAGRVATASRSDVRRTTAPDLPPAERPAVDPEPAPSASRTRAGRTTRDSRPADSDQPGPASDDGESAELWRTPWAGLLFLLATTTAAGVPDELLADEALADRPLGWTLHHLGCRLVPAAPTDPAVFALAGAVPSRRPPRPEPRTVPAAAGALDRHAGRWAEVTARRLEPDGSRDPYAVVAEIAARAGTLSVWPGWLEVHLPLDSVDVAVRRAGLDTDPGWVPWLGTVVMFRYE